MAKRKASIINRILNGGSVTGILLHPATMLLVATLIVIGGAIHLWNDNRSAIIDREQYLLTAENIKLNDCPGLNLDSLKQMVIATAAGDDQAPTLLDTGLVARTASAFRTVGWVDTVRRIEKSKDGLEIDILYREPVAMVELNGNTVNRLTVKDWQQQTQTAKLFPVDRYGVIMPGELVAERNLIRITMLHSELGSKRATWSDWPDQRVKDAASIAAILKNHWEPLGLYRIVTMRSQKDLDNTKSQAQFELWTEYGFRGQPQVKVIWGNPPGSESKNEISAEEKLLVLEQFVAKNGSLEKLLNTQKIDVRSGKAVLVNDVKTADMNILRANHK